jgi:hypothetical protein
MKKITLNKSDISKIKVTRNGGFYMSSKDIFDNKEDSLKLLEDLSKAVKIYSRNQSRKTVEKKSTPTTKITSSA